MERQRDLHSFFSYVFFSWNLKRYSCKDTCNNKEGWCRQDLSEWSYKLFFFFLKEVIIYSTCEGSLLVLVILNSCMLPVLIISIQVTIKTYINRHLTFVSPMSKMHLSQLNLLICKIVEIDRTLENLEQNLVLLQHLL